MPGAASITPAGLAPDTCGSPKPDSRFRPGSSPRSVFVSDDTIGTVYAYRWSLVNGRRLPVSDWSLTLVSECLEQSQTATTPRRRNPDDPHHPRRASRPDRRSRSCGGRPWRSAATKVVHADDRADRAAPAGMRAGPPAPVTPDRTAGPTGPAHRSRRSWIVPATASGFSWTDAAIGAAAMLGLGLCAIGIAAAFRRPSPRTFGA